MSWNPPAAPPRRLSERVGAFFRPPPRRSHNHTPSGTPPAIDETPVALPPQPLSRNPSYRPPPRGGAPDYILPATPLDQPQWRQPPQEPYQQWRAAEQAIADPTPRGVAADTHARAELNPPYGPSSAGDVLGDLVFEGRDGAECEAFVQSVKKKAFGHGKLRDDGWMADIASVAFAGQALRWFEDLDVATQSSWNLLRQALLARYPATLPPQSTSAAPQSPEIASEPFIPTPSAASAVPHPPPSTNSPPVPLGEQEAAPVPAALTNPAPSPSRENEMRPAFHLGSDFANLKFGESMTRFWVRVECSDPAASGYVSKAVTTKSPTAPSYGFHTVVSRQSDAMIVKENLKRIDPTVIGSLTVPDGPGGYDRVGLTWFETSPNYLGRGTGHTSYAHLTALKYDKDGDLETTYKNDDDGSYGDYDTDIEITGVDIWKRGTDGALTPCWKDYNGKFHDLDVAVCLHDKEISLAADYDEFAKLYGPTSFRKVRLVLESKPK